MLGLYVLTADMLIELCLQVGAADTTFVVGEVLFVLVAEVSHHKFPLLSVLG